MFRAPISSQMLSFAEARGQILNFAAPLGTEQVSTADARGRILAEDLRAREALPRFDYSSMDGYALRVADLVGTAPWLVPVAYEIKAGQTPKPLPPGEACRIFTGAPLPPGADCVVMQEQVERWGDTIKILRPSLEPFENVRRRGADIAADALALPAGTLLSPFHLGLVAALDYPSVKVVCRPRVAILCTGDELREPGAAGGPGSIPDSNGVALKAWVEAAHAIPVVLERLSDDLEKTKHAVAGALQNYDVVLTVGGVSVGDHDVVKAALLDAGAALEFWKVRIKPGKPLVFGRKGPATVFGLPGNPISAQLTFCLFVLPFLRKLQGLANTELRPVQATLTGGELRQQPGRMGFYRANLHGTQVTVAKQQASGSAVGLAFADCWLLVPEDSNGYSEGAPVDVLRFCDL